VKLVLSMLVALVAFAFVGVSSVQAAEKAKHGDVTVVKGAIEKVDGKTLTVDGKSFTYTDSTKIVLDGKPYTEDLKVGQHVTARLEKGVAVRIEVRGGKHNEKAKDGDKAEGHGDHNQPK
jgi:Domain of unknown function (DUF5666)